MNKKMKTSLEERTKSYSSEIRQISDFVEQVRQTPDVFIGKVKENTAFLTMTREIFQNSIDEILKGNAFSPNIYVMYDERNHQVTVEDNGRGIPHGKIGIIFGTSHTSSNYVKEPYKYSAGKNGCGGSATNALSHKFIVDSYVLGKAKHAEFIEGHLWDKGEVDIPCGDKQGTIVSFIPNEDYIGEVTSTWQDVYSLIRRIVPASPLGTHVEFTGIDKKGHKVLESIDNQDGILTYLIEMTTKPFVKPITFSNDNGTMKCDIAFTYDTSADSVEQIISLNNTCPTDGGTHVDGALSGITRWFRDYMNKIYLSNQKTKNKITCSAGDIRCGLKLAVSTFHLNALYNGQAKELLDNDDITPFVAQTIMSGLDEWSKTNGSDLQKLCKYFKEIIDMRLKTEKDRIKLSSKFNSSLTGLPAKYLKPNGRKNNELVIVEGDSAMGSARTSRDHATQGIFPIRGKLPNAFTKSKQSMLANEEVDSILKIIGAGYGKNFDLGKCKVDRVIIMSDADPDGAHIRSLVLAFLAVYCRPLVEAGMVYAAIPPLYGIPTKRGYRFFTTKQDFVKYVQKEFSTYNKIMSIDGKPMTQSEITALLVNNEGYKDELERVSNTYAIDPFLLEALLINRNLSFAKFASTIKKQFRFLNIEKANNMIVVSGVANEKYHKVFFNQKLIDECKGIIKYLDMTHNRFILNNVEVTLYSIMVEFNKFMPPKVTRFKGLGEMNPEMLGSSTLRPDSDRLLIQYTFDDYEKELEEMRYINSNKGVLLDDE